MKIDKAYLPQVGDQQPTASRNADHGEVGRVWEPVPHRLHLGGRVFRLPHHVEARRGQVQAGVAAPVKAFHKFPKYGPSPVEEGNTCLGFEPTC